MKPCFLLLVSILLVTGCASSPYETAPTLASLENLSIEPEPLVAQPQVTFNIDTEQTIDSYRKLVDLAGQLGNGTELRKLAGLELEAGLEQEAEEATSVTPAQLQVSQAIAIYEQYLERFPDAKDNDRVFYQLSRAYSHAGETEQSIQMLDTIAIRYPDSVHIDEAQFRRGEYYFAIANYTLAEAAYSGVVYEAPDSIFFEQALYKFGWSLFKQNRYRSALDQFTQLLDRYASRGDIDDISINASLSRGDRELLEDVLRVVSLCFNYEAETLTVAGYFRLIGERPYEPLIVDSLGQFYFDKELFLESAKLYLNYGSDYPLSTYRPAFHQKAIELYERTGYGDLVLAQKQAFADAYDVGTVYWDAITPAERQSLSGLLKKHLVDVASYHHAAARKDRNATSYQQATNWYRRYIKSFPYQDGSANINFLLAESLQEGGNLDLAIVEFEKTAYQYPDHPDRAEAGYAALLGYDQKIAAVAEPSEPLLNQRQQSARRFVDNFPQDERRPVVQLQVAAYAYQSADHLGTIQYARPLIENGGLSPDQQLDAALLVADSEFSLGNFAQAESAYNAVLSRLPSEDKRQVSLREQVAASIYRQAEHAREQQKHAEAARLFLRVGSTIPESGIRETADYDAANAWLDNQSWEQAIQTLQQFRSRYPENKKWRIAVLEKLAYAHRQLGNNQGAGREMLALARLLPAGNRKRELTRSAAQAFEEAGTPAKAISIYETYVQDYPEPLPEAMELRHKIVEFYRAQGQGSNVRRWLTAIVSAEKKAGQRSTTRTRFLAASAQMELAEPLLAEYQAIRLTIPLKQSLARKKKLLEQLQSSYRNAIAYQIVDITTEATYQLGELYREFANALLNSERPEELDELALEEYDLLLEEQAYPFEEKAIDIHLNNFTSIPQGTFDEAKQKSLVVLGQLMPFRYAKDEAVLRYVD